MRKAGTITLVIVYLAAITTANILAARYGPGVIYWNALALISLDFMTRDRLADLWGTRRWARQAALIATGSLLTYLVNRHAATIALASCAAFATSEVVEVVLYYLARRHPWHIRAPFSAVLPAAIDSLVFPALAFGTVSWTITGKLYGAKLAGVLIWTVILGALTRPPRKAPCYYSPPPDTPTSPATSTPTSGA